MCYPKNKEGETSVGTTSMKSSTSSLRKELGRTGLLLTGLLGLTLTSTISTLLQLYLRVYLGHEPTSNEILDLQIPFFSDLTITQSLILSALSIVLLIGVLIYQSMLLTRANLDSMPEVPSPIPILGTALQFLTTSPWDLMESWHAKYGPIYSFTLLGQVGISIAHPIYLKDCLQSKIQHVKKDVGFSYKPFLPILGTGIVTSEGSSWMSQRRKISGALKIDILEIIPRVTLQAVQRLMTKMDHCEKTNTTIDIGEELRHLTLQVISAAFLSLEAEESDATFAKMYLPIVEEGNKRVWSPQRSYMWFMPFFWRHIVSCRRLNAYVSQLIVKRWELRQSERQEQRQQRNPTNRDQDILDKVLAHYEEKNPGKNLTGAAIRQLRDEFKTFMLAGHETSAAMMTWTLYELMKHQDLMKKVRMPILIPRICVFLLN